MHPSRKLRRRRHRPWYEPSDDTMTFIMGIGFVLMLSVPAIMFAVQS